MTTMKANPKRLEEATRQVQKFKEFCNAQVKAHKMVPRARDYLICTVERSALDLAVYGAEYETDFTKVSASAFKEYCELNGKVLSAGAMVDVLAKEYCVENVVEYGPALKMVLVENPELAELYMKEGSGRSV